MSDVTTSTNGNGATTRKLYDSRHDAVKAGKPADAGKNAKVYEITKTGRGGTMTVGFMWANSYADCAMWAARQEGYAFSATADKDIPVADAAARLAALSDAELAALGLARKTA